MKQKQKKQLFKKIIFFVLIFFVLTILISNIISFVNTKINLNHLYENYEGTNGVPAWLLWIWKIGGQYLNQDFIDPSYDTNSNIFTVVQILIMVTDDIGSIFISTFQQIILILFGGTFLYGSLGISYVIYLKIIIAIFVFFLIIFLSIKFFKRKDLGNKKIFLNIFNSFILLIMIVLVFQILFLGSKYFIEKVLNIESGNVDIYEQIKNLTIGHMGQSMDDIYNNLGTNIVWKFYNPVVLQWFYVKKFQLHFTTIKIVYIISFLFSTWFILIMLMKFSISLFQRLIDILFFGIVGFPFTAVSALGDDGKNLSLWNNTMIQKTFRPFLSLLMYLLLLISMTSIFNIINSTFGAEETNYLSLILKLVVINGTFVVLNKFSNDWSKNIIKVNTQNNIQGLADINSSNQKNINHEFNEEYSLVTNNNISTSKNINKNINNIPNNQKGLEYGVNIEETLEKINRRAL